MPKDYSQMFLLFIILVKTNRSFAFIFSRSLLPLEYINDISSGYWVDKREVGSLAWQRVNASLCLPTQINISNLIEGRQYEFRVFAQNVAGISEPSSNSTSVEIKDPLMATPPEIIKPLRNAECIQNHNAKFECTIIGNPTPTITWYKGAREISNGSRYHIYSEGENHHLIIHDVFGEDADEYVCRAMNKGGIKSTRAELLIMSEYQLLLFI